MTAEYAVLDWSHPRIQLVPRFSVHENLAELLPALYHQLTQASRDPNRKVVGAVIATGEKETIAFDFERIGKNTWGWAVGFPQGLTAGVN